MAHNAAINGVPYDSLELFRGDPLYALQLQMVVEDVAETRRRADEEAKG